MCHFVRLAFRVNFLSVYGCSVGRHRVATNVSRAGDRNPVLRLRQGYGACTLL
jgi:hypothetical protein